MSLLLSLPLHLLYLPTSHHPPSILPYKTTPSLNPLGLNLSTQLDCETTGDHQERCKMIKLQKIVTFSQLTL